jgi:hypothetical protein
MASKTTIANRALSKLGQPRVSNIDTTDTKPARIINGMWDVVRDAVLQAYPWNFAIKRTSLAPDAVAPSWGWTYAFTPPADFLQLDQVRYNPDYEFEGGKILTDEGATLYIKYIAQITTTGNYSPVFVEALATRLAWEAAEEVTQSNTKKTDLLRAYDLILKDAYHVDAKENPIEDLEEDDWVIARL